MPVVKPFNALRYTPKAGQLVDLVAPPYDVIGPDARATLIDRSPYNLVRLLLPEGSADTAVADNRYANAKAILDRWVAEGALTVEAEPSMTVIEERFAVDGAEFARTGVELALRLEPLGAGSVFPHERTLSAPRADRLALFKATKTNLSPVFALVPDESGALRSALAASTARSPDHAVHGPDDAKRRMWIERRAEITERIRRAIADQPAILADGHHRYETALAYRDALVAAGKAPGEAAFMLCHIVPVEDPGLVVFPTHRVVRPKTCLDEAGFLARLGEYFDLAETSRPAAIEFTRRPPAKGELAQFVVAIGSSGRLARATLKDLAIVAGVAPDRPEAWRALDVTAVHLLAIERIMGITPDEVASGGLVTYSPDAAHSIDEAAAVGGIGFVLRPTPAWAVSAVARSGERMPQKSTYFYPKVAAGFAMRLLG